METTFLKSDGLQTTPRKYADYYSRQGVVYFIGAGHRPVLAVKIGVTQEKTMERRLRSIQCNNHAPLELLGIIGPKCMREAEKEEQALHARFARFQLIVNGNVGHEWFTAAPDLLAYIRRHASPPEQIHSPRSVARIATRADSAVDV